LADFKLSARIAPIMRDTGELKKALAYLEAGDWQAAHAIAQEDSSSLGAWAHGMVHILEGDLWNARYWYGRARRDFPAEATLIRELAEFKRALESA
jgi:hypothetical protein